ncbi:SMP-30/gluconolactonase/LRE family protein [Shewanella corallii]|uniref:SMP-30/gluconolactonase/LRE family protein n=1 Tax=Shewanella corallii TaxID=560080 RepID=A0ABT0N5S1_9GAMM|nr:SMP-30/gluconolactonase/LRE family protein [Shewanella corallii]MCL2913505.1 SMP-30/gluconolactonase/LRE family protein [Shewanella corallii]
MFFSPCMSNKLTLIVAIGTVFSVSSCANVITTKVTNIVTPSSYINADYCPAGAENLQLDLTNVSLKREQHIPLMYQGYNNIEGPVWHDGALYYSNLGSHHPDENGFELSNQATIWRWVMGEKPQIWMPDTVAGTNGLALDSKGNLVAARQLDGSISYIDWQTKQVTPIVTTYQKKRFNSPNDLAISHDNTIYFTDPNWNVPSNIRPVDVQGGGAPGSAEEGERIYRVTADGKVYATAVTELVPALRDKPNGIMLSLDQQQILVGGLQGLWVFDLNSGEVVNPQQLFDTPIDGLGKDCSGNIYVTTTRELPARNDGQVVVVLDRNYKEVGTLNVPGVQIVTNVAFGGDDGKTLFVTGLTALMDGDNLRLCGDKPCLEAGIYTTTLNVPGFPY